MAEWIVLGSGTLEQQARRGPSCHLLRTGNGDLLVDSGPGCLQRLADAGIDPLGLAAIVHSHLHLDHVSDLFPLLFHRLAEVAYGGALAPTPLLLSGAPGHQGFVEGVTAALYPKLLGTPLSFQEVAIGETATLAETGVRLSAFPAEHSRSPRMLRFEGPGWSVAYTGDTGPTPALLDAASGVDWLVAECTSPDEVDRGAHLRPQDIAQAVVAARPKGVALVHLSPLWARPEDAAAAVRTHLPPSIEVEIVGGSDGLCLPLGP